MTHNLSADTWDSHSAKWSSSVQEITRAPCRELLALVTARLNITKTSKVLDNGAGSGMLASLVVDKFPETAVTAADVSPRMIEILNRNGWRRVKAIVADACDLQAAGLPDRTFSHSLGTFFLPFVPDPQKAVVEMARVTQLGGIVALATWHKRTPSWVEPWQKAVRASVDPNWTAPPTVFHPQTIDAEDVQDLFTKAGLQKIETKVFRCPHTKKVSVDAAVDEFINMGNPVVQLLMQDFSTDQVQQEIRPEFKKAYAQKYDGVNEPQAEWAILVVGIVPA